jgi:hypothetical protein
VAMVPSPRRELRKGLSTPKVPKVSTPLNAITTKHECDPIMHVQCNGLVLRGVLVDGGGMSQCDDNSCNEVLRIEN